MSESVRPSETSVLPRRLPVLLRHCWYGLNQAFRRRLAPLGLTPDQFTVLRNLCEAPGLTQRELGVRMASDPNTVAALTARMEAVGWIERNVCAKDRRAHRLRLRPAGRRKYQTARIIARQLQEEVSAGLDAEEMDGLLGNLDRLAFACHKALQRSRRVSAVEKRDVTTR